MNDNNQAIKAHAKCLKAINANEYGKAVVYATRALKLSTDNDNIEYLYNWLPILRQVANNMRKLAV
jgi:hypothetical protein